MPGSGGKLRYFYLLYAAVVVALIARAHPLPDPQRLELPFPVMPEAFFRAPAEGALLAQFRLDAQRTGLLAGKNGPAGRVAAQLIREGWNEGIHSASKSSPVGGNDLLFVGSDSGRLAAFSARGEAAWEYFNPRSQRGIHSTPALGKGFVCFGDYDGVLACLEPSTGAPLWTRKIGGAIGSSPLVHEGVIYSSIETVGTWNGFVVALSLRSGALLWRSPYLGEQAHSSPAISLDGETVFVGANNGWLFALNAKDGAVKWKTSLGGAIKSTPLVLPSAVIASSWSGKLHALDPASGNILWAADLEGPSQSSPTLLAGGKAVILGSSGGGVRVHRISDGALLARHAWSGNAEESRKPSALALRNGVWMACGVSELCRFSADGLKVTARVPLGGFVSGMPWLQDGAIFVSSEAPGGIYRIGAAH